MVIAGFQPSSSFKIDKQTVPEGYTLGWNSGGTNLPDFISYSNRAYDLAATYILAASSGTLRKLSAPVLTKDRSRMLTIWENDAQLEQTSFPQCLVFARDTTLPVLQVEYALRVALRFCVEPERVVSAPLLPESRY